MTLIPENAKQFHNYLITENGEVWSLIKNRYLKGLTKPYGYKAVYLKDSNNKDKWYYIHRLVAQLYIPNPSNKPEVNHKDGNPSNNHYSNLEWMTHKENVNHAYKTLGRQSKIVRGKDHWAYGRTTPEETKAKQSQAKQGENHPKFKGYYEYKGIRSTSKNDLAKKVGTYPMQIARLYNQGLVTFTPTNQS